MNPNYRQIIKDGLWENNPGVVQLLGLCPLLAVTNTMINGIGLGLATILVLVGSNVTVSAVRKLVRPELRIPVFVLIIAAFVTVVSLVMKAFFFELYLILGIFLPLITTNCAIMARAEAFASKQPIPRAFLDGLMMGIGFACVLVILGALREVIGQGTLFSQADLMFGESAQWLTVELITDYEGFLLAILPPGAFLGLGLLIAIKNVIDQRLRKPAAVRVTPPSVPITS